MSRLSLVSLTLLFFSSALFAANTSFVTLELSPIVRGDIATVTAHVANVSDEDIANIIVKIGLQTAPKGTALIFEANNPWPCTPGVCGAQNPPFNQTLPAHQAVDLVFYIRPANEGVFDLRASALWSGGFSPMPFPTSRQTAVFYRDLRVTQSGDSGPGSLRAALAASSDCARDEVPCRVSFAIAEPVPDTGWFTIRPQTPLPPIGTEGKGVTFLLDATTQTAFSGDTNPNGPEVEIDGSALAGGNGLEMLGGGSVIVRGFAIGGFPANGIEASFNGVFPDDLHPASAITDNFIGTDAAGRPLPNGSRGISALRYAQNITIARNLVSANGRSGIFIEGGYKADVVDNVIEGNGASGVYFGLQASDCTVSGNRIASNRHFGLAVSRRANHIYIEPNSIAHNAVLGIDFGVDGPSGDKFDDYDTSNPYIPPPALTAAQYDPVANATTIAGTYIPSPDHWGTFIVSVYANDVDEAQGDVFLGTAQANANGVFTLTVPRDLRGKFLSAYAQRALHLGWSGDFFWTSEFGAAVAVQ